MRARILQHALLLVRKAGVAEGLGVSRAEKRNKNQDTS
jgi:hypothetical protein